PLVAGLARLVRPPVRAQSVAEVQVAPPSVTIKVGEQPGALAHLDRHGWRSHLNFGHILGAEGRRNQEGEPGDQGTGDQDVAEVSVRKSHCQANLSHFWRDENAGAVDWYPATARA